MKRFFYCCIVWLHPRAFWERFGGEMLAIFDEAETTPALSFFADGFVSLLRQWLVRSDAWKLVAGSALSVLLLGGWIYSDARSQENFYARAAARTKPPPPLNREQFNRETAAAVALLAHLREQATQNRRPHPAPIHNKNVGP